MNQLAMQEVLKRPPPPKASTDEWFTPRRIFEPLHREFRFTLDAAASPENHLCERYFSKALSGLDRPWMRERIWLNPPYSDIAPWAEKAAAESGAAGALVVALLPAWTDRLWWHEHVEPLRFGPRPRVELRFVKGRVRFGYPGNPLGVGRGGGGFDPSVIVIWRPG